jgi:RNA recognition motif-containing protein
VFVKNLSFQTNEGQLGDFFKQQKLRVIKTKILLNGQGQSKGLAMVEFQTPAEASYAVKELNGAKCDNREICIVFSNSSR